MTNLHECALYKKTEGKFEEVQCLACSHRCLIQNGCVGTCGVRGNKNGKLYLLVYGKIIAEHKDPIEKKPIYHFMPGTYAYSIGTIGCNFRCSFCQNWDISQNKQLIGKETTPKEIIEKAINSGCNSIAYTYNEPTIFIEFIRDIALEAKKAGLKNIFVTNGYMTKEVLDFLQLNKKESLIDAMNIDLKSFSDKFYLKNCGAHLSPILKTIKLAKKKKIHIELTTLIIPKENDSEKELKKIAEFIAKLDKNIPWHISRFFPMYKMQDKAPTEIATLKLAEKIGKKAGLKFVHLGNI